MEKLGPESIVILGMGPSQTDFRNEIITQDRYEPIADEIWAINLSAMGYRCDRVIWMDDIKAQNEQFPYCIADLRKLDKPVVCPLAVPELIPKSVTYPVREAYELSRRFFGRVYFNNGVAYAIAYAILGGVKTIKIYGCDFTYPNWNQGETGRACVESWLMAFQATGGNIGCAPSTSLFDTCLPEGWYGFNPQPVIKMPDGETVAFPGWHYHTMELRLQALIGQNDMAKNGPEIQQMMSELAQWKQHNLAIGNRIAKENEARRIQLSKEMADANYRDVRESSAGAGRASPGPIEVIEVGRGAPDEAPAVRGGLRARRAKRRDQEGVGASAGVGGGAGMVPGSPDSGPAKVRPGNGKAPGGMAGFRHDESASQGG